MKKNLALKYFKFYIDIQIKIQNEKSLKTHQ
jgi:hypothetical protein